ncbi:MAG: FHA domain-containing protein [Planctomycetes bacterium]|nr:FHA domain-containing protein [Planctomycetota bacterium]
MAEHASPALTFRAVSLPGRKPRGEWFGNSIDIGTRSTCALVLNDPVVAEKHCALQARDGRFFLEDSGSVTGTWHNGVAVVAPVELEQGDRIVVGVSRLTVAIQRASGGAELELVIEESSFHYRRAGPTNYQGPREKWVQSDADRWVQSEVRFGRIPAVRASAWIAGLLALPLGAWTLFTTSGQRTLQPEALAGSHAAAIQGCAVCHSGGATGRVQSCTSCHEHADMLDLSHPFFRGDDRDRDLVEDVAKDERACLMCHAMHHDAPTPEQARAYAKARLGEPSGEHLPPACGQCHASSPKEDMQRSMQRIAALASSRAGQARSVTTREYRFDRFAHASHLALEGMQCALCHVSVVSDPAASAEETPEFAVPSYESCSVCHVASAPAPEARFAAVVERSRKLLSAKSQMLALDWHGSEGDGCVQCHVSAKSAELRQVERKLTEHEFSFRSRSHAKEAAAFSGARHECNECHRDAASLAGGKALARPFLHGAHIEDLTPASAVDGARISAQSCAVCHARQMQSTSVAQASAVDLEGGCAQCHRSDAAGDSGVPTARETRSSVRRVVEFPHARHAGVEGGCFACHEFDDDPLAVPRTKTDAADCSACHSAHRNIQRGACSYCHASDPDPLHDGDAALFRGASFTRDDWPKGLRFSHFSSGDDGQGHKSMVLAEAGDEQCGSCHDLANLRSARRVRDIAIPGAGSMKCVECHAFNGHWFHWQLPSAK